MLLWCVLSRSCRVDWLFWIKFRIPSFSFARFCLRNSIPWHLVSSSVSLLFDPAFCWYNSKTFLSPTWTRSWIVWRASRFCSLITFNCSRFFSWSSISLEVSLSFLCWLSVCRNRPSTSSSIRVISPPAASISSFASACCSFLKAMVCSLLLIWAVSLWISSRRLFNRFSDSSISILSLSSWFSKVAYRVLHSVFFCVCSSSSCSIVFNCTWNRLIFTAKSCKESSLISALKFL